MKKGKWKVFENYCCEIKLYQVGRIKDTDKPVHSGNIEYSGCYESIEQAQSVVDKLNNQKEV